MNIRVLIKLLKETFKEWQQDDASSLAASLAYYTSVSLAPLLIIVISIAGAVFGEEAARGEIVSQIQGLVGTNGAELIETAIENADQPQISNFASIISIIILLFGASGVFAQLQKSLNKVWQVQVKSEEGWKNLIRKRILSFSAILGLGFLLLVSLIISAALSGLNHYLSDIIPGIDFLWQVLDFCLSFVVIALVFGLMYRYLPDVKISWDDVKIGAIITALLFTIGKFALGLYLGRGGFGSVYGAAGSLVIILVWVYYSAQILFFGAEFTQVYARRYGSKIVPNRHARFLDQE
ncbi:probable ribonuclease BN [Crocosphaera subtropica ATCC 51142]|uniref:Probable ribonuclease BN n=1 Tax=Crocosphaera subtropica (strain ATCC 51142 / BH68) TaxID=43989 RepID=B1WZJ2_CROS5|nr:YihY/virulence factor BrkB family protein [Crocosphaera subtropica]ACB51144.1 probable ribonuclease BN [Crocosphaera subtropica ATCC 51142]